MVGIKYRVESDSLGEVHVPAERLFGPQTQRSLEHFSIGKDLMPRELISAYAILKKAAAIANLFQKRLSEKKANLIIAVCDEILAGGHTAEFPLHVWISGSGTQFNMNVNEVIANRSAQLMNLPLGKKTPIHPNDDVNLSQSSNDTFPSAMNIAAAIATDQRLLPALRILQSSFHAKAKAWKKIVKLGRTHMQDATPLTLGQEFSGYAAVIASGIHQIETALQALYPLALGGTAVGTGFNTIEGFDKIAVQKIAKMTNLPFRPAKNKFAVQSSHGSLVQLSAALRNIASAIYKISNDIRLLSCGPCAGFYELLIPSNEPGSSMMPGKVNPTQCEALAMVCIQIMANDVAVGFGDAGGYLEMNVYKPLIIHNLLHSIQLLSDCSLGFERFLLRKIQPNRKRIQNDLEKSLMLVTALSPAIGYDKASQIAHYALQNDLTLKEAALRLKFISSEDFDRHVNPMQMCSPAKKSMCRHKTR